MQHTLTGLDFDREIGVFGAGLSGQAVQELVESMGGTVRIYDENPNFGCPCFDSTEAARHTWIVNSPGFQPNHLWFEIARRAGCQIVGEIEFARQFWTGKVIYVTGTNGKSTITELQRKVLERAGFEAFCFGNIGVPFSLHYKTKHGPDAIAVIEVSSFQAWNLNGGSADGMIWTNFAEDHIDWHGEMVHYFDAKWNALCQVEDGPIVLGEEVLAHARIFGKTIPMTAEIVKLEDTFAGDATLSRINRINIAYVKRFVAHWDVPESMVDEVVRNFTFLPHRMEHVATVCGVDFWNDSKGTNSHAVEAALECFCEPVVWIGGGLGKGENLGVFARKIAKKTRIAFTFGTVAAELANALIEEGVVTFQCETLAEVFVYLKMETHPGDQVLFSPGFASFDQFNNYRDRGERFRELVEDLQISTTQKKTESVK